MPEDSTNTIANYINGKLIQRLEPFAGKVVNYQGTCRSCGPSAAVVTHVYVPNGTMVELYVFPYSAHTPGAPHYATSVKHQSEAGEGEAYWF